MVQDQILYQVLFSESFVTLKKHIENMKAKLFVVNLSIVRIRHYGYSVIPLPNIT